MGIRNLPPALALVLASLSLAAAPAAVAETPHPLNALDPDEGLGRLGAWFEEHPGLKDARSSGWKPYNRMLWFAETRTAPEGTTAGILRQRALETAKERSLGSRAAGWFSTGPTQFSGRVTALDFHPTDASIVYVGAASGGLWKSTDGGDSWTPTTDDLPTTSIGAVCALHADPDIVLIGTGEGTGAGYTPTSNTSGSLGIGLLKSTDGGITWGTTSLSYPVSGTHGFNLIADNPTTGTILAAANDGLWRSSDNGDTWTEVQTTGNFFDIKWKPGDANRVYITKGQDPFINGQGFNGVKVSTDDGLTFSLTGTGQPPAGAIGHTKLAVTAADPSVIYAHYVNPSGWTTLGIYRSTDDGATWQLRNNSINMTGAQGWYNCVLACDPDNADRIVTGGVNLYTSDDGGSTFVSLNASVPFGTPTVPHWDNHVLHYEPGSSDALWIGTDGGVWRSTDDGSTWASRREGIISYQYYDICVAQTDPDFAMGGTQDNGIPGRSGADWFHSTFVADGMVCNINPTNANRVFAEWQFGNQIKSNDSGQNWTSIQNGLAVNGGIWVTPVDQNQQFPGRLLLGHTSGIWRTTNGGGLWSNVAPHFARWISVNPGNGDYVWTVSNFSGVWVSSDGGTTWTSSGSFPATGLETKIDAHPTDPNTAFVTFGGYGTGTAKILRTTDLGATWADVTGDFPDQPANTFIVDPVFTDEWYLGSDVGVWMSSNGGVNWSPVGAGLPSVVVTDLEIRREARKLVAGTYGRGVWEMDLAADPTSIGEPVVAASANLMLDAPVPNPVRDAAMLRFAARSDAAVTLEIYDVAGRLINTLAQRNTGTGVVERATWIPDGVANGIYFAVLRAGEERVSRKMVLTR
ncbi:MAG: hypothetical protein DHS20C21_21110 [Gemmatimonadota bacterium]|nr:MAG: hypothetical protein DHS20C21_21110 [Gemmatimonadota bacterium]